jgi:hypothetical protein
MYRVNVFVEEVNFALFYIAVYFGLLDTLIGR